MTEQPAFVPCGTMADTEVEEAQVSRRTREAVFRRCPGAGGADVVTRQTEAQLCSVSLLPCAVCAGRTLAHAGAVWKKIAHVEVISIQSLFHI